MEVSLYSIFDVLTIDSFNNLIFFFRKVQQIVFNPVAYLRPNPTNSAFKPSSSSAFYAPFKGYDQSTDTLNLAVLSHAAHTQPPATSIEG